jgi:hypothetical protein|tara:strand:- start:520 stop:864 length:345 start_codon:yes stop_codon:yes gene_type:complete
MAYLKQKPGSIEDVVAKQQTQYQDPAYQKLYDEELKNTMGGIGSMTPKEKQSFHSKIDSQYKKEGLETMIPNKKDDVKDLKRKVTMTGEKPTKVDMEPEVKMDTQKPYSGKTNK